MGPRNLVLKKWESVRPCNEFVTRSVCLAPYDNIFATSVRFTRSSGLYLVAPVTCGITSHFYKDYKGKTLQRDLDMFVVRLVLISDYHEISSHVRVSSIVVIMRRWIKYYPEVSPISFSSRNRTDQWICYYFALSLASFVRATDVITRVFFD